MTGTTPSTKPADDHEVDEAGEESFPASDPPFWTPTHPGRPAPPPPHESDKSR